MDYDSPPPVIFKDLGRSSAWTPADTARQIAGLGLLGADWAQTRTIAKNPSTMGETNPILGAHPSVGKVNNYFAANMIGNALLARTLPPGLREALQYGTIGLEAGAAGRNKFKLGIGMTF
jgi:hypothetical protein